MSKLNMFCLALICFVNFSQSTMAGDKESVKFNDSYAPASVVKRLSYENFRNIRLLRTAILNYGGGEAEVQKLVDQYAEASALYFQDKVLESAEKYMENERDIFKVAQKIAKSYHDDTVAFLKKGIKRNIKITLEREVGGKHADEVMNKYLNNARYATKRANSIYDDFKYVNSNKSGPPAYKLITAIYYYRLSKQNLFQMYNAYGETLEMDKDKKKNEKMVKDKVSKMLEEDYKPDYKKDLKDNENQVYVSKEKKI